MILGSVKLKKKVVHTVYHYGNVETIQNKCLPIMGNDDGIFTCIVKGEGLVQVHPRDILEVELYKSPIDPLELVECLVTTLGCQSKGGKSPPN